MKCIGNGESVSGEQDQKSSPRSAIKDLTDENFTFYLEAGIVAVKVVQN